MQLCRDFVSKSSEFCRHNPLCCFSTCAYFCKRIFHYRFSPETFGYTLLSTYLLTYPPTFYLPIHPSIHPSVVSFKMEDTGIATRISFRYDDNHWSSGNRISTLRIWRYNKNGLIHPWGVVLRRCVCFTHDISLLSRCVANVSVIM
jgi:hypothetical protein